LRLKILKKLRTASLNSEFTGSYKKKMYPALHFQQELRYFLLHLLENIFDRKRISENPNPNSKAQ